MCIVFNGRRNRESAFYIRESEFCTRGSAFWEEKLIWLLSRLRLPSETMQFRCSYELSKLYNFVKTNYWPVRKGRARTYSAAVSPLLNRLREEGSNVIRMQFWRQKKILRKHEIGARLNSNISIFLGNIVINNWISLNWMRNFPQLAHLPLIGIPASRNLRN